MSGHWGNRGGGVVLGGGGCDINHKDKIDSFFMYTVRSWPQLKSVTVCENINDRTQRQSFRPPDDPLSLPIRLSCHFYFPSFILSSVSFLPSLTSWRIKCIRGAIHLLPLSDTGSQLSADRKGPIKHWRRGNTVGQLILYCTSVQ